MLLRIKEILSEKGFKSQKDLAEALGIAPQRLNNIANGKATASFAVIEEIANKLGVPTWQLFVSPEEASGKAKDDDFVAMVRFRGEYYHAGTIDELEKQIADWKEQLVK